MVSAKDRHPAPGGGDVAVVVLQKDDAVFQTSFAAKSVNLLISALPASSRGWAACKNELHRTRRVIQQAL